MVNPRFGWIFVYIITERTGEYKQRRAGVQKEHHHLFFEKACMIVKTKDGLKTISLEDVAATAAPEGSGSDFCFLQKDESQDDFPARGCTKRLGK